MLYTWENYDISLIWNETILENRDTFCPYYSHHKSVRSRPERWGREIYLVAHPTARKWAITPVIYMG